MSTTRHYEYAPFGANVDEGGSWKSHWRFSSEYDDKELSLIYYNYRLFSSSSGRWLGRERLEEDENLYLFTYNNPILFQDRNGDEAFSAAVMGGVLAAYVAAVSSYAMIACYNQTIDLGDGYGDAYHHCYTSCAYAKCITPLMGARLSQYVTILGGFLWEAVGSIKIMDYDGRFSWDDLRSDMIGVTGSLDYGSCDDACKCEKGKVNP